MAGAVADPISGRHPRPPVGDDPGHGLRSVDERLRKAYGPERGLEIRSNSPRGTIVTIKIPAKGEE